MKPAGSVGSAAVACLGDDVHRLRAGIAVRVGDLADVHLRQVRDVQRCVRDGLTARVERPERHAVRLERPEIGERGHARRVSDHRLCIRVVHEPPHGNALDGVVRNVDVVADIARGTAGRAGRERPRVIHGLPGRPDDVIGALTRSSARAACCPGLRTARRRCGILAAEALCVVRGPPVPTVAGSVRQPHRAALRGGDAPRVQARDRGRVGELVAPRPRRSSRRPVSRPARRPFPSRRVKARCRSSRRCSSRSWPDWARTRSWCFQASCRSRRPRSSPSCHRCSRRWPGDTLVTDSVPAGGGAT